MSRDIQIQTAAIENRSDVLVGSVNAADVALCAPAHLHLGKRPRFGLRGKHGVRGVWTGSGPVTRRYASTATTSMGMSQDMRMPRVAEPAAAEEPPAALWAALVLSRTLCS